MVISWVVGGEGCDMSVEKRVVGFRQRYLGFERLDAFVTLGKRGGDVGGLETLGDMPRTIRVPGGNDEKNHMLGARLVAFWHQLCCQLRIAFDDARLAPDLDALPVRIIDQEQVRSGIVREIAKRDILPIASEIDKADGPVVKHPQKACWAAAMLDIWLALGVRGGEENARLRFDEAGEIGRDAGS